MRVPLEEDLVLSVAVYIRQAGVVCGVDGRRRLDWDAQEVLVPWSNGRRGPAFDLIDDGSDAVDGVRVAAGIVVVRAAWNVGDEQAVSIDVVGNAPRVRTI